tara:strand:- start:192 stop:428 length:237 start_codon:yes stop_codon:yes gene_type:complete
MTKGKTDRKRYRRMCHGDTSGCRPEVKIEKGEHSVERIIHGKSPEYDITPYIHKLHFRCTKTNEEAYLIEDITGDEEQ